MEVKKYKLGELLSKIENGAVIKQNKGATGIPITRIETLSNGLFNRGKLGYADIEDPTLYANYVLEDNDLLMSHINSKEFVGRTVIYKKQANECIIHGMNLLRIKTNAKLLDPEFTYYYFQTDTIKRCLYNLRKDAIGQSSIAISDIKNMIVSVPNISIQKEIAFVLRCYDRRIELNRAINQNLEAMAKQLYDYWFVQFDFPNEEGKPYKSSGGEMVWNEKLKKMIPKEWTNANIYQLANISKESINPQAQPNDLFKHYSLPEYDKTRTYAEEYGIYIQSAKFVVTKDCILVSKLNPWTSRVICGNKESNQICSTEFVVWNPISMRTKGFLFMLAKSEKFIEYCTQGATGTSHSHRRINPELMMKYEFPYNSEIAMNFSIFIENIIEQIHTNITQLKALTKQRNELLPLLMNGQVSVNSDLSDD